MPDVNDMELLRNYCQQGSEDAFARLVQQHINLVYSAALRHVGMAAQAEEITQAVFIILARKAAGLHPDTILEAWLYETTRLTSLRFLRGERRRQWREQEAYMQSTLQKSTEAADWRQLAPLLDVAMARLEKKDREALILRFFEEKKLCDVAAALQITEAAAQSRVFRAVEKLRRFFTQHGVVMSATVLTTAIGTNSVQAAPAGLANVVTAIAVAKGAAASTSTLTLIQGALKIMAWTKAKTALLVVATIAVTGGLITTGVLIQSSRNREAGLHLFNLVQQQYASLGSFSYAGTGVFQSSSRTNRSLFSVRLGRPCSYRTEAQTSGSSTSESLAWTSGDSANSYASWLTNAFYKIKSTPEERLTHYDGLDLDLAMETCLPTEFFYASDSQNPFKILTRKNTEVAIYLDGIEKVAGYLCHRLVIALPKQNKTLTLWVGSADSLIYQAELRFKKADAKIVNHVLVYSPVTLRETYTNVLTNPPLQEQDFIPENIPAGLTVKESFP